MRNWYENMHDKLWRYYSFHDTFSEKDRWYPQKYLAIDQGHEVVMVENYRSGMLWKLFMRCSGSVERIKEAGI